MSGVELLHLLGHEPQPGGEVAPLGKPVAGADRGDHGAGDNRSDAKDAHQPNARGIAVGKLFDLAG